MRWTSPRALSRATRAFTLIELSVVVFLIVLLVAAVAPNLVAMKRSQVEREFPIALRRIAVEARERAIASGTPLALTFGDQLQVLNLVEPSADGTNDLQLRQLVLTPEIQTGRLEIAGSESNSADWVLRFYPDGTSDGGGVEFTRGGNQTFALVVDAATGSSRLVDGPLPDTLNQRWQAGEIEHRL